MTKRYTSFEEIEKELKILKLQREISLEQIKINLTNATKRLRFQPLLLSGSLNTFIQQTVLTFAIKKLRKVFGTNRPKALP